MPTPRHEQNFIPDLIVQASASTCPTEPDAVSWRPGEMDGPLDEVNDSSMPTPPSESQVPADSHMADRYDSKQMDELPVPDMLSPMSTLDGDKHVDDEPSALSHLGSPSMGYDFSNVRLIPSSPSSFLRAGSRFRGTQQSERQVYEVQVEIKHVDMRESFLCGYLRIQGLTEDHPTLTTYFEGEIIGSKYSFLTQHQDWGSSDKVDLQHWAKFSAFRPFQMQARKGIPIAGLTQRDNIFMRWKEHFLVPDHRVRTITGASFEGFYYICFNQIQGNVSGIYFHAKSERFQQLELKHVEDKGCTPALEFR